MSDQARRKKPVVEDWHPADVLAALRKQNWSLRQLGFANGLNGRTINTALQRPYPRAERIIADALGIHPKVIWPTRYNEDGTTNRVVKRPVMNGPKGHVSANPIPITHACNPQAARAE